MSRAPRRGTAGSSGRASRGDAARIALAVLMLAAGAFGAGAAGADELASSDRTPAGSSDSLIGRWFALSDAMKESQPHWMTPIVTVTPRLEQEFRYDQTWQSRPGSVDVTNYDGGKGLELIPLPD